MLVGGVEGAREHGSGVEVRALDARAEVDVEGRDRAHVVDESRDDVAVHVVQRVTSTLRSIRRSNVDLCSPIVENHRNIRSPSTFWFDEMSRRGSSPAHPRGRPASSPPAVDDVPVLIVSDRPFGSSVIEGTRCGGAVRLRMTRYFCPETARRPATVMVPPTGCRRP
jgi:hypothetical protein